MISIDRESLRQLLTTLKQRGYSTVGPVVRDGGILLDEVDSVDDLPKGWKSHQDRGSYRLEHSDGEALFGYVSGPSSWKRFLFPPTETLFRAKRKGKTMEFHDGGEKNRKPYAFIGVRPCELSAMKLQDKVFLGGEYRDPTYAVRRADAFIVAVNCTESGGTCFCASMKTGPRAGTGFDIVLTELTDNGRHLFLADAGSEKGSEMLNALPHGNAEKSDVEAAERRIAETGRSMPKQLSPTRTREGLLANLEGPWWEEVAHRCLLCANCTLVCPTCFCSSVEDTTDLSGMAAERRRRWDSCFTSEFAKVTGGNFRPSPRARYRQWMTHKLVHWVDQFGAFGCVGCGRCITWCPVGIDITVEAERILANGVKSDAYH